MSADIPSSIRFPYPGLRPFERHEAPIFFGRGAEIDKMLTRLEDHQFLAVVGASGSGKSSLVRAGLLPALEDGFLAGAETDWHFVIMRPGDSPFARLASAICEVGRAEHGETDPNIVAFAEATLRSGPDGLAEAARDAGLPPDANVLVLVDQFEEIFRFRSQQRLPDDGGADRSTYAERNEASAFVNLLLATARKSKLPIHVVITMRSDFLGDCDAFFGLPEAIDDCQFLTPRMTREQLRDAITGPVDLFGGAADAALVNQILNDVGTAHDQLPLMQHALMRTWMRTKRKNEESPDSGLVLQLSDYEAVGGLEGALSQHADTVYEQLGDARKKRVAEVMFRGLCDRGAEARLTRRLVTVAELAAVADVSSDEVIEVALEFLRPGRTFIVSTGPIGPEATLDISHEALIRQWKRMGRWLTEEAESAAFYGRLSDTARLWKQGRAGFWSALDLEMAQQWKERQQPTAAWAQRYGGGLEEALQLLDASAKAQEEEQRKENERQRSARRVKVMRRAVAASMLVVAVLIAVIFLINKRLHTAVLAGEKARTDERNARTAEQDAKKQKEDAEKEKLASKTEGQRTERIMYNDHLARVVDTWGNVSKMRQSLLLCPEKLKDFTWNLFDRVVNTSSTSLPAHDGPIYALAVSADGNVLASAGQDGTIRLWDASRNALGSLPLELNAGLKRSPVYSCAFSPRKEQGHTLFAWAGRDGIIRIWKGRFPFPADDGGLPAASDRVTGEYGPGITTLNPRHDGYYGSVRSLAFSPDGNTLASGGDDSTVRLWDVQKGSEESPPLEGHSHWISCLAFSPDCTDGTLASASYDTTIKLWDPKTRREPKTLWGHEGPVLSVGFSTNGKVLASSSSDTTIRVWNAHRDSKEFGYPLTRDPVRGHTDRVNSVVFARRADVFPLGADDHDVLASAGDNVLVSAGDDGMVKLWDVEPWRERLTLHGDAGAFYSLATLPALRKLASANSDGTIRLWTADMDSDRFAGGPAVAFSPDTRQLAFAGKDQTITLYDLQKKMPKPILALASRRGDEISFLTYDPTGKWLAFASKETVWLWDAKSQSSTSMLQRLGGHTDSVACLAFSPDGNVLASASRDKTIRLWSTESRQELTSEPLSGHTAPVAFVDFSPDGTMLASCGHDGTVRLWNTSESKIGQEINSVRTHEDWVLCVRFSPKGNQLATASEDKTIKLWNVQTLLDHKGIGVAKLDNENREFRLEGHTAAVTSLAFLQEGHATDGESQSAAEANRTNENATYTQKLTLASGSMDQTVRLWDPVLGFLRGTLKGHRSGVRSLAFRHDGKVLASADDNTVRLWIADDDSSATTPQDRLAATE